ncbi:hypothetical protein EH223_18915 [candidate division KSB1 bacterium]|nr:hypothetical protein [candidate division KSB1 bacterium]RQW00375.1 MAG: hypothetical protein EH223_18915 [candidate division KSB1 bacterium]
MSENTSNLQYSFLPYLRQGISTQIDQVRDGEDKRARTQIPLNVNVFMKGIGENEEEISENVQIRSNVKLYGPGDVTGFNPNIVVRTDPKADVGTFEPNYCPTIEFAEPDFPWRFSPEVTKEKKGLQPWICLIVLRSQDSQTIDEDKKEFEFHAPSEAHPIPSITVKKSSSLPNLDQAWAWAHVQVFDDIFSNPENRKERFTELLKDHPERLTSRLVCPRKLAAGEAYSAFVVPVFEAGRLAGLGKEAVDNVDLAWVDDKQENVQLPVYYTWSFRTGNRGDFESLVRLLRPQEISDKDGKIGKKVFCVNQPGYSLGQSEGTNERFYQPFQLKMEGALVATDFNPEPEQVYDPYEALEDEQEIIEEDNETPCATHLGNHFKNFQFGNKDESGTGIPGLVHLVKIRDQQGHVFEKCVKPPLYACNLSKDDSLFKDLSENLYIGHISDGAQLKLDRVAFSHDGEFELDFIFTSDTNQGTITVFRGQNSIGTGTINNPNNGHSFFTKIKAMLSRSDRSSLRFNFTDLGGQACELLGIEIKSCDINYPDYMFLKPSRFRKSKNYFYKQSNGGYGNNLGWFSQLNLDPRHRIAAAYGTRVIQEHQEELMDAAWEQIGDVVKDVNQKIRQSQLGKETAKKIYKKYFSPLLKVPDNQSDNHSADYIALAGPILRFINMTTAQSKNGRPRPSLPPIYQNAGFRKMTRSGGVGKRAHIPTSGLQQKLLDKFFKGFSTGSGSQQQENESDKNLVSIVENIENWLNPENNFGRALQAAVDAKDDEKINRMVEEQRTIMTHPKFQTPMYEDLRDLSADYLLPGVENIKQNSISLLSTNRRFIEAYMAGLNHEMARELLWREFPTDQRGTCFKQFWDRCPTVDSDDPPPDLKAIHLWEPNSDLGDNGAETSEELVLLIRGELLYKYPNAIIYAIPAKRNDERIVPDFAAAAKFPTFRGIIPPDITFIGFSGLDAEEAKGKDGNPGWYFVLQQQVSEPRFGFDVERADDANCTPSNDDLEIWNQLAWMDILDGDMNHRYIDIENGPTGMGVDIKWNQSAADFAYILHQMPARVAVHGEALIPELR